MKRTSLRVAGLVGAALAGGTAGFASSEPVDRITPDLAALARQPMIPMPFPPNWAAAGASPLTIEELIAEFNKSTTRPPAINYTHRTFVRPDHEWLLAFVRWFRKLGPSIEMHYEDQLFDCDKFARCFVAFADLLAHKGGETRGSICVGWCVVFNAQPFADIEAGGGHAVVIVATSQGLFVIEPQNGTLVPIGEYPNRDNLLAVYL